MILIDKPSPFAPKKEWEEFLRDMQNTKTDNDEDAAIVADMIVLAKSRL